MSISQESIEKAFEILGINEDSIEKADMKKTMKAKTKMESADEEDDAEVISEDADFKGKKSSMEKAKMKKAHYKKGSEGNTEEQMHEEGAIRDDEDHEAALKEDKKKDEEKLAKLKEDAKEEKAEKAMSGGSYNDMMKAMKKAMSEMDKAMQMYKGEMEKAMATIGDTLGNSHKTQGGTEEVSDNESTKMAMSKGEEDTLEKGLSIDELVKAEISKVSEEISALGTITKSMNDNFSDLENRLSAVENVSRGRKSAPSANYIQKGFDGPAADGSRTLSVSQNKNDILNVLESKADFNMEKGYNNLVFAEAMAKFEATNTIDSAIAQRLRIDDKINIVA